MDERKLTGMLGVFFVVTLTVMGLLRLVRTYVIERPESAELLPTMAILLVAVGFVVTMSVVGAKSRRWRQNPYW